MNIIPTQNVTKLLEKCANDNNHNLVCVYFNKLHKTRR